MVEMGGDWERFRAPAAEAFRRPRLIVMRIGLIVALVFRKKLIDRSLVIPSQIVEGAHHGGAIRHALSQQVNGDKKRDGTGCPVVGPHVYVGEQVLRGEPARRLRRFWAC